MRLNLLSLSSILAAALCCAVTTQADPPEAEHGRPEIIIHPRNPNAQGGGVTVGSTKTTSPIKYHGGPLIETPAAYIIWYGNWDQKNGSDTPAGQDIVRDFLKAVGGSPYYKINNNYSTSGGVISGNVTYGGETTDTGSQGKNLSDSQILTVVLNAIPSLGGYNPNGVYFVLTSSDVTASSGFCTQYCGWHSHSATTAGEVKFSFVGNAKRCLSACAAQSAGPNGNAGVDAMLSVIAHELEEAATDPVFNGWWDGAGYENADKCAWTFGTTQGTVNIVQESGVNATASYNMSLDIPNGTKARRSFLIQRNLLHGVGKGDICAISYEPTTGAYFQ
jgi:hypothetical protein